MKLNHLICLGAASLIVAALPITSRAGAIANPSQQLLQTTTVSPTQIARNLPVLLSGAFVAVEKPTTGQAQIVKDGKHYYLELNEAFQTSNQGPDLHVLLDAAAKPPKTYQNMSSPLNLGRLRSYSGTQRYPIPDSINPAKFQSVVIWCRMANATFGYAPLKAAG
jgi:hypothetical protein